MIGVIVLTILMGGIGVGASRRLAPTDTLKYDDGVPEGYYVVGYYKNDKLGVRFFRPYLHYKVRGMLVFADNPDGFRGATLCGGDSLPDTLNPWIELDSVYSSRKEWRYTPIELEVANITSIWVILRVAAYPGVGGDINNPSGNSWYCSDSCGWKQSSCNWLIRLIIQEEPGYYEDFASSPAGYTGDWEFGVPSIIPPSRDNCFGTKLDILYPNNTYLQLESPWIFVADYGLTEPVLIFKHFYDTQFEKDGGNVKISKDTINWQLITPLRGYDIVLSGAAGLDGELGFSGSPGGWRKDYFYVPVWDSFKIKWCFGSDIALSDSGWFIDEVKIGERPLHDVSPISINFRKIIPPDTTIVPRTEIKNLGIYGEGVFPVKCMIESCGIYIYQDIQPLPSIGPDSTITVNFTPWRTAKEGVTYNIKVYTEMPGDEEGANDTIKTEVLTFLLIDSITAGQTHGSAPTIDGIIDSIEWQDATVVDGSDVLGIDSTDPCGSCKLYFMNSRSFIYIGAKANSINEFRVYLDETGDGRWNTDGSEGAYRITQDEYKFQDMYYHIVHSLPDSLKSVSAQGVEIGIPIGLYEPYEIMPTESIRCFIQANSPAGYVGWWPQQINLGNYNNPAYYAKVKIIGAGAEERAKCKVQSAKLEIYPNPFRTKTVIRVQGLGGSDVKVAADFSLRIYDLVGRLIKSFSLNPYYLPLTTVIEWDASNLPAGLYFLIYTCPDAEGGGKVETTKIIKKFTIIH